MTFAANPALESKSLVLHRRAEQLMGMVPAHTYPTALKAAVAEHEANEAVAASAGQPTHGRMLVHARATTLQAIAPAHTYATATAAALDERDAARAARDAVGTPDERRMAVHARAMQLKAVAPHHTYPTALDAMFQIIAAEEGAKAAAGTAAAMQHATLSNALTLRAINPALSMPDALRQAREVAPHLPADRLPIPAPPALSIVPAPGNLVAGTNVLAAPRSNSIVRVPADARTMGRCAVMTPGIVMDEGGRQLTVTLQDLRDAAAAYDPDHDPTPVVWGEPKLTAPAYGWVEQLVVTEGVLLAVFRDLDPALRAAWQQRLFKNIRTNWYLKGHPNNPTPHTFHARQIVFAGGPPAPERWALGAER